MAMLLQQALEHLERLMLWTTPAHSDPQHWYLSPRRHLAEGFAFVSLFSLILAYAQKLIDDIHPEKKRLREHVVAEPWRLTLIEHLFRISMTFNLLCMVFYKFSRSVPFYMLQPCHIVTAVYLVVLYSTDNYRRAYKTFNVAVHWGYFPLLALLFPDTGDLTMPFEVAMFWIHHWVLFLYPIVTLFINRFPLDRYNSYYYWLSMACNGLVHYLVQTPAGLYSGTNVGYMLWPPPKLPRFMANLYWRAWATLTFFMWSFLSGYIVPFLVEAVKSLLALRRFVEVEPRHMRLHAQ